MNNEVYTMVPKLYTIAKYGHTKVNRRRVFKLHISAEAYTMDHEGYTKDYEGYTMDYDNGAMAIRCLKDDGFKLYAEGITRFKLFDQY